MALLIITPQEMLTHLAVQAKAKRLSMNLAQEKLALRSGVSYGVLKKFERTGQISLASLLKIALTLESLEGFYRLFDVAEVTKAISLEELMQDTKTRKRGRK